MTARTGPLPAARRRPLADRVPTRETERSALVAAHDDAMDLGEPGYLDPVSGLFVMTAAYLWDRGDCCDSGCRHCPFVDGVRAR